jgi:anti-anti-sigma factor
MGLVMTSVQKTDGAAVALSARQGNFRVDCGRAQLKTVADWRAMVARVTGEVDACNAALVREHLCRFVADSPAVVIDMASLDFLAVQGLRDLFEFGELCGSAGVRWVLVTGDAVRRILRASHLEDTLPTAGSLAEALQRFSDPAPTAPLRLVPRLR